MVKLKTKLKTVLGLAIASSMVGCVPKNQEKGPVAVAVKSKTGDHNSETTLAIALAEIDKHRVEIKEAFLKKQPEDAHDALHEVGHSLESIVGLSGAKTVEAKQSVKKAVDELFECFGALDDSLHGKTGKSYEEVGERIDAALAVLKGIAKQ